LRGAHGSVKYDRSEMPPSFTATTHS
jgi:hypothetical protein